MKRILVVVAVLASAVFVTSGASAAGGSACVNQGGTGGCYSTIQDAVTAVGAGGTVSVAAGTYMEDVQITMPVTLRGAGADATTIDAAGLDNGVFIDGVNGVTVSGFTVENGNLEGILAQNSSHVTIADNAVTGNDQNLNFVPPPGSSTCDGALPLDQEDCGEGIHLLGTSYSTVSHNTVVGNAGGILLSDETGPTHGNTIVGNTVQDNPYDCGITLASHVLDPLSTVDPSVGGVYDNSVVNNTSDGNGGAGAGVYAARPGAAAYGNTIAHNTLENNGLPGVGIHSHAPLQNVNGNTVANNTISGNHGDSEQAIGGITPPIPDTGIDVLADPGASPISQIAISANRISDEYYGIFAVSVQHVGGLPSNKYDSSVANPTN